MIYFMCKWISRPIFSLCIIIHNLYSIIMTLSCHHGSTLTLYTIFIKIYCSSIIKIYVLYEYYIGTNSK